MSAVIDRKLRLMVVDDEADNLDLLYRTFRRDFYVFKAESALAALQILQQEGEMGIIISDQRMPKMSGTEFLSQAAQQFPDTIRILLTGYTDVEDLVDAINSGKVFKYITKPWNPEQLKTVVMQAAETYRVLKDRTHELNRALRRESMFNAVTTAIRESLDYRGMLQTIVSTLGHTFAADYGTLRPVERAAGAYQLLPEAYIYSKTADQNGTTLPILAAEDKPGLLDTLIADRQAYYVPPGESGDIATTYGQLLVPLCYQQDTLALLGLYHRGDRPAWSAEDIQLIEGVIEQAALALSQAKLYQRTQQQTEQMQAELAVARQIQMNLLRQEMPTLDYGRIQAYCHTAREVGGDFFEVFVHSQGDVWLAVGDVSGKGVPAALFMASAISVLRRELAYETPPEPHEIMHNLNRGLMEDLVSSNCFITMVLARYSPQTRRMAYANAGHIYPLIWSQTAEHPDPTYLKARGVPLGILPQWTVDAAETTMAPGDVFLLTSDGITEATVEPTEGDRPPSQMLHQSGLWQILMQQPQLDLPAVLSHVQIHNAIQEDDQTILALEVF